MSDFEITRQDIGYTVGCGLATFSRNTFGCPRASCIPYSYTPMDTLPPGFGGSQFCIFQEEELMDTLPPPPCEQYSVFHVHEQKTVNQQLLAALSDIGNSSFRRIY